MIITGREELEVIITEKGRAGLSALLERLALLQELYEQIGSKEIHEAITEAYTIVGLLEGSARPDGATGVMLAGATETLVGARTADGSPIITADPVVPDKADEKKDEIVNAPVGLSSPATGSE